MIKLIQQMIEALNRIATALEMQTASSDIRDTDDMTPADQILG